MELDLGKRTVFKVKFDGKTHDMRKPTVAEVGLLDAKMKEAGGEVSQLDVTKEFLHQLGMPMEVLNALEVEQFGKLLDGVTGIKKN